VSRTLAAAVAAVVLGGLAILAYVHGKAEYARGHADEKALWIAAAKKEEARQAAVNADALRWQRMALSELQKQAADLSALLETNDAEAAKDPLAARPAVGRDSVRRLNTIH
jgi:hypothetical protein